MGFQRYHHEELRVQLPSDRDIAIGNIPNVDEHNIYAIDMRDRDKREYYPLKEPGNAVIQQGFTSILKDAVRDIACVLTYPFLSRK